MPVFLLVVLVIAIVVWALRQQSPGVQVAKAYKLAEAKRWEEAIAIFKKHFEGVPAAAAVGMADVLLQKAIANPFSEANYREVLTLASQIPAAADKGAYDNFAAKASLAIAKERYNSIAKNKAESARLTQLEKGLKELSEFIKTGEETGFQDLRLRYRNDLYEASFSTGMQLEKGRNFPDAIKSYGTAALYANEKTPQSNAEGRIAICKLKSDLLPAGDGNSAKWFTEANSAIRRDYKYRLAIQKLRAGDLNAAERLADDLIQVAAMPGLTQYIANEKKRVIVADIEAINAAITKLQEQQQTLVEIEALYERVQQLQLLADSNYPRVASQLSELRPAIFNRLLSGYNKGGQYGDAAKLITDYPRFWESPELLKSLAQCAIGLVTSGQLTKANYKDALSAWLTAACSDKVILSSLEATTWDDEYTFTLADAMGSAFQQHSSLPDNVNYEAPDENNISIGETQRELIAQFEQLLHAHIADKTLQEEAVAFYHQQLEAIRQVVAEVPEEILFAAPHFAEKHSLKTGIIKALETEYNQYKAEKALEAALLYGAANMMGTASTYAKVKEQVTAFSKAIAARDYASLKRMATADATKGLQSFTELSKRYETEWTGALKTAARQDDESVELADGMEAALKFFPQSEQLKHLFAIQIADVVIGAVNEDRMSNHAAFLLMLRGYKAQPENARVAGNLVKLVDRNLMDIINDRTTKEAEIFAELDKLKTTRSNAFKAAAGELAETRKGIINELKKAGQDVSWLTTTSTPPTVTAAGHKLKKALTKMLELSGGSLRDATFDPLFRSLRNH